MKRLGGRLLGCPSGEPRLRRLLALILLGVATLLLTAAGASGRPDVPGDAPPAITPLIFGTLGSNGWYTTNVSVNWTVENPPILWSTGCGATTLVAETTGTRLTCSAENAGGVTSVTITIKIDKTAPAVSGVAERQPDANGWYNRPLTVSFSGTDGTAGIQGCSTVAYSGPDSPGAAVAGTCRDNAGNVGSGSFAFKYDTTLPTVSALEARAGKRSAQLRWVTSPDTQFVELVRSPGLNGAAETVIYRGEGSAASHLDNGLTVGRKYQYRLTGSDEAANRASRTIVFVARGALLSPAPGERVSAPPRLAWTPVKGATYYNVVLVRGRRVYSAWPVRPRLQLARAWVYRGHRQRLRPGVYRWFVWPGFGRLSAGRYGRLLGRSSFVVSS